MKRLMFTLALLATIAVGFGAVALEVKSVHSGMTGAWDGARAAGEGVWIVTGAYTNASDLPKGIMIWTGDGSDYWMKFKVETGDSLEVCNPQRIPSYMLVPLSAGYDTTNAAGTIIGWKRGVYVSAPTDSIFYRWLW